MLKIIVLGLIAILFQFPNTGILQHAPAFNQISYVLSMIFYGVTCMIIGMGIGKNIKESKTC